MTSIAVTSGKSFPVRRIFCVGQNYSEHAREMGGDPDADPPFFFTKPTDAIAPNGAVIPYPPATFDFQHEVELVVAFSGGGRDIEPDRVDELIFGYAVGLDMTRRDIQAAAKKKGRPWDMSKGFDFSAPCGAITPMSETGPLAKGAIECKVNGETRQRGDLTDMIWKVPRDRTVSVRAGRDQAGRSHLHRHAGRRRPRPQGRRHRGDDRRIAAADGPDRLSFQAALDALQMFRATG